MGRNQEEQEEKQGKKQQQESKSLRSKAAHFVSDITTGLLNPISDKPSHPSSHDDLSNSENSPSDTDEDPKETVDGPDTSSFSAFLYSFLASSESKLSSEPIITRENAKKRTLFSKGKHSLGKAFYQAAKVGGFRNQASRGNSDMAIGNGSNSKACRDEGISMQTLNESVSSENLPETSEPSLLLSEKTRSVLYAALPVIVHGRKWMLLYSTWRHGISLSTLYRRSMIWPGLSLLVVGDGNGAVFGGLVEAPLRPTSKRRYQGSNNSFVFTNISGHPLIFRPTGMNRYFTLCSTEYLAMGGGGHFALYLDGDLYFSLRQCLPLLKRIMLGNMLIKLRGKCLRCKFCHHKSNGGITRLKDHLAQTHKGVAPCPSVPADVKNKISERLKIYKVTKTKKSELLREIGEGPGGGSKK